MNLKYFEHIVKYLPVVVAGAILGALARVAALAKGVDDYTANIIFLSVTSLSVIAYALIVLFLDGIIKNIKILPRKHNSTNLDEKLISTENIEKIREEQQKDNQEKSKDNFVAQLPEIVNVDLIRKAQQQKKLQNESEKLQIALDYTRNQFALYLKDEDLDALCEAVNLYSQKKDIFNNISIYTNGLTNLDLYHFGWNIWNHFRPIKQEEVSKLLKNVFVSLDDIDLESIKSHLKDEPKKGIIKILENLADYQKT